MDEIMIKIKTAFMKTAVANFLEKALKKSLGNSLYITIEDLSIDTDLDSKNYKMNINGTIILSKEDVVQLLLKGVIKND